MLCATDVTKTFGSQPVLRGVDLKAQPGEIVGLLGANGAGKSTLIGTLAGLDSPDSGNINVGGISITDSTKNQRAAATLIGLAPQQLAIYPTLSGRHNLETVGGIAGLRGRALASRIDEILTALDLVTLADRRAGTLSGGQQRRLHTAMAILHRPKVLFLDEPTVAADVASRTHILAMVKDLADQGSTIIYTSHYLNELEHLGGSIAVLQNGVITVRDSLDNVITQWAAAAVTLTFRNTVPELAGWSRSGSTLKRTGKRLDPSAALAEALAALGAARDDITDVRLNHHGLEAAYIAITETAA